jgi:hypothetical protein
MSDRNTVLKNYANFVARLWEDDQILPELEAQPRAVLKRFGFDIPEDAEINLIIREINLDGSPETQVDLLAEAQETGVYDIIVPTRPEGMELQDIPLEDEVLELVAGGSAMAGCCCPCCSCCPCCDSS